MSEYDLFDLVDLSFDPPENKARQIKKQVDQKLSELNSALNRETQQTSRNTIQLQIDYLKNVETSILSADGKKLLDSEFKKLADKKTYSALASLTSVVMLLGKTIGNSVTNSSIRYYRKKFRLSDEHVKEVFTKAGFNIVNNNYLKKFPKFPTNSDRIYSDLASLRTYKDPNPNGADTSSVSDLYMFAAYLSNELENSSAYRSMGTKELWNIFNIASQKFSQRTDDLGKLCGAISTAAKTYVFNSEENRSAYNQYLLYRSYELTDLFEQMKKVQEEFLLNSKFADACISIICKYFPEYEVALAIYNREACFKDDFYIPTVWMYTIKCNYCDVVNEFDSEKSAVEVNSCKNCKKALFKKCEKCSNYIPVYKNKCPDCGYVFASAELFAKFYKQAELAFKNDDFTSARQHLLEAQELLPFKDERVVKFGDEIDRKEKEFKEPIDKLRKLILDRKYFTAKSELSKIAIKYPGLNIDYFANAIDDELKPIDELFKFSGIPTALSNRPDTCLSILSMCPDYEPALELLRATPPVSCANVVVLADSKTGFISVRWSPSKENGVAYRIVRKNGTEASSSESDGDVLVDEYTDTLFVDKSVNSGQSYTYSVFAVRVGAYSKPVSGTAVVYSAVKNCSASYDGSEVSVTWDAPKGSLGAYVSRECDGEKVVLAKTAYGCCRDSNVKFGKTYTYRVFANYSLNNKSQGVDTVITPIPDIESFSIKASHKQDNVYNISWDINEKGVKLRLVANNKIVGEVKSDNGFANVTFAKNNLFDIFIEALSGNKWVRSKNNVTIDTYVPCEIDKKSCKIEDVVSKDNNGNSYSVDISICLSKDIEPNVSAFYFAVRNKNSENKWATKEEIGKSSDIRKISINNYRLCGCIPYKGPVTDDFFISVFTCYSVNGKEIISQPSKVELDRHLIANLLWSVSDKSLDNMKFYITLTANKRIEYVPELLLCSCEEGQFISSPDDKNVKLRWKTPYIEDINSTNLNTAGTEYKIFYPLRLNNISDKDLKNYKFSLFMRGINKGDEITARWDRGFFGKIMM